MSNISIGVTQAESCQKCAVLHTYPFDVKRIIRNARARQEDIPVLSSHCWGIILAEKYKKTYNGDEFLMYDSGLDESRMLILCTRRNL